MNADIQDSLNQLNKSHSCFEHKGKSITKKQVKYILEFGLRKGYKSTSEFSDEEIDKLIKLSNNWDTLENSKLDEPLKLW